VVLEVPRIPMQQQRGKRAVGRNDREN
jgi:hypothetical protein